MECFKQQKTRKGFALSSIIKKMGILRTKVELSDEQWQCGRLGGGKLTMYIYQVNL